MNPAEIEITEIMTTAFKRASQFKIRDVVDAFRVDFPNARMDLEIEARTALSELSNSNTDWNDVSLSDLSWLIFKIEGEAIAYVRTDFPFAFLKGTLSNKLRSVSEILHSLCLFTSTTEKQWKVNRELLNQEYRKIENREFFHSTETSTFPVEAMSISDIVWETIFLPETGRREIDITSILTNIENADDRTWSSAKAIGVAESISTMFPYLVINEWDDEGWVVVRSGIEVVAAVGTDMPIIIADEKTFQNELNSVVPPDCNLLLTDSLERKSYYFNSTFAKERFPILTEAFSESKDSQYSNPFSLMDFVYSTM